MVCIYTEYNYVTENKNNACITILDSDSGEITQSMIERALYHHISNELKTKRIG